MRRLLNQCANAAVKRKGSIFEQVYRRLLPRIGHSKAIWAIAHRLCRLIGKILRQGIRYDERGPAVSQESTQKRTARMIRELRSLGYRKYKKLRGHLRRATHWVARISRRDPKLWAHW